MTASPEPLHLQQAVEVSDFVSGPVNPIVDTLGTGSLSPWFAVRISS
jgi:hypothetical protein